MHKETMIFPVFNDKETSVRKTLTIVYDALVEKGYSAINQIVGYLLTEDPTYITKYNNARSLITKIDRNELLKELIKSYLKN
ncbi:MAG: IreB family regulatory phosphoprotein [Oscillospiraceae bacterium]|jgi:uncharacterized protein (UPF0297 family)|nr:IreB family regulatory phosphoprotein [Oscillospiraceae bacterium]